MASSVVLTTSTVHSNPLYSFFMVLAGAGASGKVFTKLGPA